MSALVTERLYYADSWLRAWGATVIAVEPEARAVVLDRSAFYPEAGGQLADHGTLSIAGSVFAVCDVQTGEDGVIRHTLAPSDAPLPSVGEAADGAIDFARRRVHMALHSAQHMLSQALLVECGAATVSARLGETACTIDVDVATIDEAALARAEASVNSAIDDDLPVRAFFPSPDELAALSLRRAPKVTDNVRVVVIEGFDVTPCGGTHVTRTAQIGLCVVDAVERYKGKLRVTFLAGGRARTELSESRRLLGALGRELSTAPREIPSVMAKLRAEITSQREALGALRGELATRLGAELAARAQAEASAVFVAALPFPSVELLRSIGARIVGATGGAAFLVGEGDASGRPVIVTRAAGSTFECGATLKRAAQALGGRGGGRPEHAEGRVPSAVDVDAIQRAISG